MSPELIYRVRAGIVMAGRYRPLTEAESSLLAILDHELDDWEMQFYDPPGPSRIGATGNGHYVILDRFSENAPATTSCEGIVSNVPVGSKPRTARITRKRKS